MARKLNADEHRDFSDALLNSAAASNDPQEAGFLLTLDNKRDKALTLSPELSEWFGKEFLLRSDS
jgi:hypothetical protein